MLNLDVHSLLPKSLDGKVSTRKNFLDAVGTFTFYLVIYAKSFIIKYWLGGSFSFVD